MSKQQQYRWALVLTLVGLVPLGYGVRFAHWPGLEWFCDGLGSVAYEMFWMALVLLIRPWLPVWQVALGVFGATGAIEFLQLWQPDWLQALRATLPGRLVLGNTFTWTDFLAYVVGCLAGWVWLEGLRRLCGGGLGPIR
jgi:hypothetical protein